jgi:hypothetical protein
MGVWIRGIMSHMLDGPPPGCASDRAIGRCSPWPSGCYVRPSSGDRSHSANRSAGEQNRLEATGGASLGFHGLRRGGHLHLPISSCVRLVMAGSGSSCSSSATAGLGCWGVGGLVSRWTRTRTDATPSAPSNPPIWTVDRPRPHSVP